MDNAKRKIEELMTAVDRIVESRESKPDLFGRRTRKFKRKIRDFNT